MAIFAVLTTCLLALLPTLAMAQNTAEVRDKTITPKSASPAVQWPPATRQTRPWTRWWWLGSAVDKPDLTHLLETYHAAGLGGVEITPIYGVKGQETRDLPYLSPAWLDALRHTLTEAHRLDMGVDMPTGTGWPFGGPQVTQADAQDKLVLKFGRAAGGQAGVLPSGVTHPHAVMAVSDRGETVSLLDKVDANGVLHWTAPGGDDWTLYAAGVRSSGMQVKRAAPGGEGRCINPFSKTSLTHYLTRFDQALAGLSTGALRCQFHDSFEYQADWMPTLFEEFLARRGYDLRLRLPEMAGQGDAEASARVRTDYHETVSDLLRENFTQTWTDWAHTKGSLSRNQAHGSPGNLLDLYGTADIPETEVFRSVGDVRISKFASSAAHVMGKPLVSSESCTWQSEHFTETLGQSKHILDRLLVAGINHVFYHGTAYSPADAAWPGWLFYASTHFEPNNPTWRDFPALNAYVTRCQSLLQAGHPDNDVLLYWPLHDLWQKHPKLFGLTIEGKWLESEPVGDTAQFLWNRGYGYDYISDRQLQQAKVERGALLRLPGGLYRTILVPHCKYMPLDTLQALLRLAHEGATVLFQDGLPDDVPGYGDLANRRRAFHTLLDGLQWKPQTNDTLELRDAPHGKGHVRVGRNVDALLAWTSARRESLTDRAGLMFVRRTYGNGWMYFLVNQGDKPLDGWVPLNALMRSAVLMDPMTGRTGLARLWRLQDGTQAYLQMQPGESLIVCTSVGPPPQNPAWTYRQSAGEAVTLAGTWNVDFVAGGPTLPHSFTASTLRSWTDGANRAGTKSAGTTAEGVTPSAASTQSGGAVSADIGGGDIQNANAELQRFAGTARYTLHFDAPPKAEPGQSWRLDLGDARDSVRVRLNGLDLGTLLAAPFQKDLPELKPTGNTLEVEVTNVAANRIRDLDRRKVEWKIFREINFVNIDYKPFDASGWPVRPAGLLGPVRLIPMQAMKKEAMQPLPERVPARHGLPDREQDFSREAKNRTAGFSGGAVTGGSNRRYAAGLSGLKSGGVVTGQQAKTAEDSSRG